MSEPPDDLTAILERIRRGEEAALVELLQRYAGVIRRAARGMLGQAMRAELDSLDLVQSLHKSLLIGVRKGTIDVSSPDRFVSLALVLLRRKISRHWRRIKRQTRATAEGETPRLAEARALTPLDPAAEAQWNDTVRHLLAQLDDEGDRRLVQMRLQGYSTAEAARQLGLDAALLRVRLGRLRQRLRERGLLSEWI